MRGVLLVAFFLSALTSFSCVHNSRAHRENGLAAENCASSWPSELRRILALQSEPDRGTLGTAVDESVKTYRDDAFDCDEITRVLTSQIHLSQHRRTDLPSVTEQQVQFPEVRFDVLHVWVNPTCPVCRDAVRLIRRLQSDMPSAPSLVIEVVGADGASAHAAATLELVRQTSPDLYMVAVLEVLERLPGNEETLDEQVRHYLGDRKSTEFAEFSETLTYVRARYDGLPKWATPPVVTFRGRLLDADNAGGLAFDPFRSLETLRSTILLIRAIDKEK